MRHVSTVRQFDLQETTRLIERAEYLRTAKRAEIQKNLAGMLVATLFYEPSTRTRLSFEAAVYRLGGQVISAENAQENSSSKKGETLADVFRIVGAYVDAIVIRHHSSTELEQAMPYAPVPVINAGAGSGEHPTQALLDVYTIWRELGRIDNLSVAVLGDLKYGRTVHSLLRMFAMMSNISLKLYYPEGLGLPGDLLSEMAQAGTRGTRGERRGGASGCGCRVPDADSSRALGGPRGGLRRVRLCNPSETLVCVACAREDIASAAAGGRN